MRNFRSLKVKKQLQNKNRLITGVDGFIGSHLTELLLQKNKRYSVPTVFVEKKQHKKNKI